MSSAKAGSKWVEFTIMPNGDKKLVMIDRIASLLIEDGVCIIALYGGNDIESKIHKVKESYQEMYRRITGDEYVEA